MAPDAPWLGGYVHGGDPATFFPDLWTFFARSLHVTSVLDIGCGEGICVRHFQTMGIHADGIDGVDTGHTVHDFTTGPFTPSRTYDLGWACEFLEHIEERFLPNLASTFQTCKMLAVTHAFPGQGGHHHVNCREPDYWRGYFAALGFHVDEELTRVTRAVSRATLDPYNHFARSGLCLTR